MIVIFLIFLLLTSSFTIAEGVQSNNVVTNVDLILDNIELAIRNDSDDIEAIFHTISKSSKPVSQLQRNRLMLLQAHHLIIEKNLPEADAILTDLLHQKLNQNSLIRAMYLRGLSAYQKQDFEQAFSNIYQIEQYPKLKMSIDEQFDIINLAINLHIKSHTFEQAKGYAQRAISLARVKRSSKFTCYAAQIKSNVYTRFKDFNNLNLVAGKAIEACEFANEYIALADINVNLSQAYKERKLLSVQQSLIEQSISIYEQHNTVASLITARLILAELFLEQNKLIKAEVLLNQVFELVEQRNQLEELVLLYRVKAMLFEILGLPDDAMYFLKKYLDVQHQSNDMVRVAHIAYLKVRFNNKVESQAVLIGQIEKKNIKLIAKTSMLTNLIFLFSALLTLSLSVFLFTFYRKKQSTLLVEHANIDELTQLPLFTHCLAAAQHELDNSVTKNSYFSVISIDLDFMSAVNNSFSHDFGDILLQAFSHKVKVLVDSCGFVSRGVGDSFIVFASGNNPEDITQLAIDIHQCLEGITIDRKKIMVSCSSGLSMVSFHSIGCPLDLLIEQSAQALRQAKFNGRNQWVQYEHGKIDVSLVEQDYRQSGS